MQPERIGRYRVVRRLGQGGMGVVYEGHDDRLDRAVAIKVIRPETVADPVARGRFEREARAAARVNHPHICALYEFDEQDGHPFLVMELLAGESLASRLERGPLPAGDVFRLADQILDALSALHRSGITHRDLKPANIHLTPHGAKLMDFGLAQPALDENVTRVDLTGAGTVVGTPQYMSPERLFGQPADERSDVWSASAVIYELASGAPAFSGATFAAVVHAIGYDDPKPLQGSSLAMVDRVLRGGLAKNPSERVATAAELAARLRTAASETSATASSGPVVDLATSSAARAVRPSRFVALPLRILRPDSDTDFLAFSIPDAVSSALAGLESVIVRAPRTLPAGDVDARAIGREWAVDVVLAGTLMRAGSLVRVNAQLIDATDGTLRWSDTAQAPLTDLFQLQDTLTTHIVSSLQLPLSGRDRRALARLEPANPEAYALYMRANQLMTVSARWADARDLYERAVSLDPTYAPAWVGLGLARRVLAKWTAQSDLLPQVHTALAKALELDPELASAHDLAASVDVELGLAPNAMARLLERACVRPRDASLMTGLVVACRYSGLLAPSLAAHARAAVIDADVRTSVCWTHFHLGDYAAAIATDAGSPPFCALLSKMITGDIEPESLRTIEASASGHLQLVMRVYRQLAERQIAEGLAGLDTLRASGFNDPEGWFAAATFLARAGATDAAMSFLDQSIDAGFISYRQLTERAHWRRLEDTPGFPRIVERARELFKRAEVLYERAGGPALLGPA